ncbi:MAG: malonyl-CoA decarboxylase [Hyphomicrobiales bacterium]
MNVSFFQELLGSIGERGRKLLDLTGGQEPEGSLEALSRALLSSRGEASGIAIASEILSAYKGLDEAGKLAFFRFMARELVPVQGPVEAAASAYLDNPGPETMARLAASVDSPRQEYFRRLNMAQGATHGIVSMRSDLLHLLGHYPELVPVDRDLMHLLSSWFNRGFLVLRRIDWSTPASILEKIIQYEAVHEIRGWDDLRRRLDPRDRRCYGFFHPSLVDEPLIFVEVALTQDIPESIRDLLIEREDGDGGPDAPTTAVFYSISNCQEGLRGISFGSFLIKQVAEDLSREIPSVRTFVTLSPVPRFAGWLARMRADGESSGLSPQALATLKALDDIGWAAHADQCEALEHILLPLAAAYLLKAKTRGGSPVDPVARFHLGNGARLERLNWLGDRSPKAMRQSHGLMVNYLYDLKDIEKNHEAYVNEGAVASSRPVRALLKASEGTAAITAGGDLTAADA